jgi:hypothetical protein
MTIIKHTHTQAQEKKNSDRKKEKKRKFFLYNKKREDKFTDISSHKTSEREKNPTEQQINSDEDEENENKHKIIITKLVVVEVVQHVSLTELEDENDWYS